MDSELTILVPTHNRPAFLRRLLHYLDVMQVRSQVAIFDSSRADLAQENAAIIDRFGGRLAVTCQHTQATIISKCRQALEQIRTPYAAFCADDDFLLPDAVAEALEFLHHNPDYGCAQGIMASLCTTKRNQCYLTPGYSLDDPDPLQRFRLMAGNWFSTFYAVYRTPLLLHAWRQTDEGTDYARARIFPEILLAQMSVLVGKVRFFPRLYNLREEHQLNESLVVPEVTDAATVSDVFAGFRACLADELSAAARMPVAHAVREVNRHYGWLSDGGISQRRARRRLMPRATRAVRRSWLMLVDSLSSKSIRQRRRLRLSSPLCKSPAWQLAHQLMTSFPDGLPALAEALRAEAA